MLLLLCTHSPSDRQTDGRTDFTTFCLVVNTSAPHERHLIAVPTWHLLPHHHPCLYRRGSRAGRPWRGRACPLQRDRQFIVWCWKPSLLPAGSVACTSPSLLAPGSGRIPHTGALPATDNSQGAAATGSPSLTAVAGLGLLGAF